MTDVAMVGWVITKAHVGGDYHRIGWGQSLTDAQMTVDSFNAVIGRTITMHEELTEEAIAKEERIRWRSFDDDGERAYEGVVRYSWLYGKDDEDLAYNIDVFNMEDVGAVHVFYNKNDIIRCSQHGTTTAEQERMIAYVEGHPGLHDSWPKELRDNWIEIYG